MKDTNNSVEIPDEIAIKLTVEEQEAIGALDSVKIFKKGSVLISEGQFLKESYYVLKGLLRQFSLSDGDEITSNFYSDDEPVSSCVSAFENKPSTFTLICLEDSTISVIAFDDEKELCKRFPRFDNLCRISTEKNLSEQQEKFARFIASSPEQRYKNLIEDRPELIDRVPQYHLSSYLGMKPESLSRIRKRLASK